MTTRNMQLILSLLSAANAIERRLNRVLSNVKGISFTEYQLLQHLSKFHSGSATRVDLARAVSLSPSAVTRALRPMEKIGLVSTQKGERDARQNIAVLTRAGEEMLRDAQSLVHDEIALLQIPRSANTQLSPFLKDLVPK